MINRRSVVVCQFSIYSRKFMLSQVSARGLHKQRSDLTWFNIKHYAYRAFNLSVKKSIIDGSVSFFIMFVALLSKIFLIAHETDHQIFLSNDWYSACRYSYQHRNTHTSNINSFAEYTISKRSKFINNIL